MRVIVLTSDKYIQAIRPYAHLFNKYWGEDQQVLVAGFTPPDFDLPPNFSFHSIGQFSDYPMARWSDALIALCHQIPDEVFTIMLEDYWITRPVYRQAVSMLTDWMHQFKYTARMDLTGDRKNNGMASFYGKCGHLNLVWSNPDSQYHMSMMTGIWRKEHLLRVLIPNETAWEVELQGTPRLGAMRHEMIVLGTEEWPVKHTLAFRGGDSQKLLLDELDPADVAELAERGLLAPWGIS